MKNEKQIIMPVNVLNYSSLTQLLRNPLIFKVKNILGVYTGKKGVSSMIGSAGHEALKTYYGGNPNMPIPNEPIEARGIAISEGLKYLDGYFDAGIRYGKTGSREKMIAGYTQAMQVYFDNEPEYHEILYCEEKMTGILKTTDGQELPLPASFVPDLVHKRKDGGVEIIDIKFVTSFTELEDEDGMPNEDYIKIVQAMFGVHVLKAAKGVKVDRVIFREVKRTINKEGGPQIRDYAVPADHEPYRIIFYNLYKECVKFLQNPEAIFLPNLSDPFDGQEAGLLYAQGLISADMSDVEIMHRVRDVAFTTKKFVPSQLERADYETLLPEERVRVKLAEFGILVDPQETKKSAAMTQYRFKVSRGTSMAKFAKYKNDIIQALAVKGEIRILTPIPGTSLVGIEVENDIKTSTKLTAEHLRPGTLDLPIGVDVNGEVVRVPLDAMPHLLVAGATGSGKSVLIHNFITALTKQMMPEDMELLLIDPKRVELAHFARKPHLHGRKVIYEYEHAVVALLGLVDEMEERYRILEKAGKRDIAEFNASKRNPALKMRYIVTVVDEFADFILRAKSKAGKRKPAYLAKSRGWLMAEIEKRGKRYIEGSTKAEMAEVLEADDAHNPLMRDDADVELLMVRLAQMARATGIHLIVATQRPSVDVITGLIKANFPTRIALTTASATDSNVILGKPGAEKLSGKGDMLFLHPALKGEMRLQGFMLGK